MLLYSKRSGLVSIQTPINTGHEGSITLYKVTLGSSTNLIPVERKTDPEGPLGLTNEALLKIVWHNLRAQEEDEHHPAHTESVYRIEKVLSILALKEAESQRKDPIG